MASSPLVIILPPLYMVLSLVSLSYFKVLYTMFTAAANANIHNLLYLHTIQPTLRQLLAFAQASLGPADKMTFSLTHILLMMLCLVLTVQVDKLRSAFETSARR